MPMGQMDSIFPIVGIGFMICLAVFVSALFFRGNVGWFRVGAKREEQRQTQIERDKAEVIRMIEEALERHQEPLEEDESVVASA